MLWYAVAFVTWYISIMSSIRNRLLATIWNGGDSESTSPMETKKLPRNQSVTLSNDSGYASGSSLRSRSTNVSLSQPATARSGEKSSDSDLQGCDTRASTLASNCFTPRRSLHKAASTTFKFFSDSIRSKTQLFYVESERPGTPYPIESGKTRKQDHKSRILSSLRSRHSRRDKGGDEFVDQVVSTIVSDIPHELHVDIPDSNLLEMDSLLPKEAQYAKIVDNYSSHSQCPPPPANSPVQLKPLHIPSHTRTTEPTVDTTSELKESIIQPDFPGISLVQNTSSSSEPNSIVHNDPSAHATSSDGGEAFVTSSLTENQTSSSPQAAKPSKGFRTGGNLFVKGNREQNRRTNIPSPYRRALRSSESLEVPLEHPANPPEQLDVSHEVKAATRPSIKRATSLPRGLSNIMMSDCDGTGPTEGAATQVFDGYDGDAESSNELLEEPNMGPRSSWDKARADRLRRYQAVRTMSAETVVDTSDEEGLQLRPFRDGLASVPGSPSRIYRKVRFATAEEFQEVAVPAATISLLEELSIPSENVKMILWEARPAAESTEQPDGEDMWHLANELPAIEIEPHSSETNYQTCSLSPAGIYYAIEAIDRPTGISMLADKSPAPETEALRSETNSKARALAPASILYAVEAIDRPSGTSMNTLEETDESNLDCSMPRGPQEAGLPWSSERDFKKSVSLPSRLTKGRQLSSCSVATEYSCAVTTNSPLCYKAIPAPSIHLHNTPVRRTSSIIDEIHQIRDETGSQQPFLITPPTEASSSAAAWSMQLHPPTPMKEEMEASCSEGSQSQSESDFELIIDNIASSVHHPSTSRSSSMCALTSDFVEGSEAPVLLDTSPRTTPRESDLHLYSPQPQSSMPGTWDPDLDLPNLDTISDPADDMSEWMAEHPDSSSLLEAGFGQDATDPELDFLAANPELGQYLDRAFPEGSYGTVNPTYSNDEDEGFRTPMSSPLKRVQRMKRDIASVRSRPLSIDSSSHHPLPSPEQREGEDGFIAARLPSFKSERSVSSNTETVHSLFTPEEVLLRDISPTGASATRSHTRTRSWQMRDSSFGGEEFTYDAVGSPKKDLQTSSVKKGVWWGRNGEEGPKEEEESPLAGRQGDFVSAAGTEGEEEDEPLMKIEQHLQRSRVEMKDLKALLTSEKEGGSGASVEEVVTAPADVEVAKAATGAVEKGEEDKENTLPERFLSPKVEAVVSSLVQLSFLPPYPTPWSCSRRKRTQTVLTYSRNKTKTTTPSTPASTSSLRRGFGSKRRGRNARPSWSPVKAKRW